jgi:hypothetical protein
MYRKNVTQADEAVFGYNFSWSKAIQAASEPDDTEIICGMCGQHPDHCNCPSFTPPNGYVKILDSISYEEDNV